jgi:two-component system cell cycle response regulator
VEEVAYLAESCARILGLDEDEVDQVRHAAVLHDIGKLAIPESILNKPGPLTADEWDFVRRHTVIGERVLSLVPALRRAAALVRSSHESWDGSGYPDGLAGDQIPVGARIVAVADAFSAMTEDRPHAAARSVEDALAELLACSGTQFDPDVVAAFVSVERGVLAGAVSSGSVSLSFPR